MIYQIRAIAAAIAVLGLLSACATQLPSPTLSFDNVQRLRAANIPPIALGEFTRAPSLSEAQDRRIGIRADSLRPPVGATFSSYLRSTIEAELVGVGVYDPASMLVLSAQLNRSEVSTGGADSGGVVGARFRLARNGVTVFEKDIVVEEQWPFALLGYTAINDAMNHYAGLYPKLFGALLADEEFLAATR